MTWNQVVSCFRKREMDAEVGVEKHEENLYSMGAADELS
jgi:hypothetical protein